MQIRSTVRVLRTRGSALCLAALCGAALPATAHANGRYPKADQLVVMPDHPDFLVVRATFGLLISSDTGQSWDWVCERAMGYSGIQDPSLALMEGGTILAGLDEGLARASNAGCNWGFSEADLGDAPVIDVTVPRTRPSSALALIWDPRAGDGGYSSRILSSDDNARTFVPYGNAIDPSVLVLTLDTAGSDAHRVYASGTRTVGEAREGLLFSSNDDGEHWTEHPVPFDPKLEQGVYIAAIDPNDANVLYLRTSSVSTSRLLVTRDGGETFRVAYSGSLLAFALSPDGSQLYFGGEDGLHAGTAADLKFEQRSQLRLLCLAATGSTLYACSDEHNGFTVGASTDGGFSFEPKLHLNTVRGPLACTESAASASCAGEWPATRARLGIIGDGAAGASGAAGAASDGTGDPEALAGAGPAPSGDAGSGCSVGAARQAVGSGLLLGVLGAWLSRRARRSRGSSRPPAR